MGDLNLPFEAQDPTPFPDPEVIIAGGVVVMAAVTQISPTERMPGVVFRFAKPDGSGFYTPVLLASESADLSELPNLIAQAVATAVEGADVQDRR